MMNSEQLLKALQKPEGRKLKANLDINWFVIYYLSNHFKGNIYNLHREWLHIAQTRDRVILAAPRYHAKTTTFSLAYVLHCILFQKKKFIILISDTLDQAQSLLGAVIEELETNERILRDFGKIAGYIPEKAEEKQTWTAKEIVTTTGVRVIARGWKSKLRGIKAGADRPDLIVIDDLENDESVQSEDQREKVRNVFYKSIMNLGNVDCQMIMVGTILHFDSLLQRIIETPPEGWYTKLYRAIINDKPIWPEIWSIDRLMKRKAEIGTLAFEQEFMNNPIDPSSQILHLVNFYDRIDPGICDAYCYLDLASKEKEQNDWTAAVSIYRERESGKLYTVDPQRMKGKIDDLLAFAIAYYKKHHHLIFGIEANSFQVWFSQLLQDKSSKLGVYLPIQPIEQIKDKVTRALSVAVYSENGTVSFNKAYQDFNAELEQFPKAQHDDWTDSYVEGIKLATSGLGSGTIRSIKGISYGENY